MIRPKIYQVVPNDNYEVTIYYDNGEIRLYNAKWILDKTGIFEKIKNIETFKSLCTVMNGTLAWDISKKRDPYDCIDLCPDGVYEDSIKLNSRITA